MTWLEVIRVRSPEAEAGATRAGLQRLAEEIRATPDLVEVRLYSDVVLAGDFAVHLAWDARVPAHTTGVGQLVAELLRRHGLVDHRVWKAERARPARSRDLA